MPGKTGQGEERQEDRPRLGDTAEWKAWIAKIYGSMADAPIERGEQGSYEVRESFE